KEKKKELEKIFDRERKYLSEDTSFVVFGSLARREWTSGSDLDWTFLIDGEAHPEHLLIAQEIRDLLDKQEIVKPGRTGIFGNH
ncbi:nucleotidyltransferase domain-containing protein, partial [Pseudenterobacter timonensis]